MATMGPFNNREIATLAWILVFAAWAIQKAEIRRSTWVLIRTFCNPKILGPVGSMAVYVTVLVTILSALNFWTVSLLKDTLVWFFVAALALMVRFVTATESPHLFRSILIDSIKVVILLEFLVNTYVFPLVVELILLPILTFVVLIEAIASLNKEYIVVARAAKGAQAIIGVVIVGIAVGHAISDFQNLNTWDTLRSVALAPLLTVLLSPFIYTMALVAKYELVFIRLKLGCEKDESLKRYARYRIIRFVGLSLSRLQYLLSNHVGDVMHVRTTTDVDRFLRQARNYAPGTSPHQAPDGSGDSR